MDLAALRRWWPLAAVLALLFVISLAATRSAPHLDQITPDPTATTTAPPLLPPRTEPAATPAPTEEAIPEAASGLPDWVGTAALASLGTLAIAMVVLLSWALIRDGLRRRGRKGGRLDPRRPPRTAEDLVAALDAGIEELSDTDRDPRRAVIACWVRLEDAAAAAGTPRHPGDSPTDLVGRLLAEQRVDAGVLAALLEVYREARYATHTVDDQMRQQARSALERLRADLGVWLWGMVHNMSDDGSLSDLFGLPAEPAADDGPAPERRRSPVPRLIGEAALIGLTTMVIVAAMRASGVRIPLLLIVTALVGLRAVMWAASVVAPPPAPKLRSWTGRGEPTTADSLRAAVRRWEHNLERAHSDPGRYGRNVLPVLAELTDERLRLRHGITRDSDPRRARELLGEGLWSALAEPGRRGLRSRDIETFVETLERL